MGTACECSYLIQGREARQVLAKAGEQTPETDIRGIIEDQGIHAQMGRGLGVRIAMAT